MAITKRRRILTLITPLLVLLFVGCGMGPEATATPSPEPTHVPVPTYTSTPIAAAADSVAVATPTATLATVVLAPTVLETATESAATISMTENSVLSTTVQFVPTPTMASATARLTVAAAAINVRGGPDTTFPIIGSAAEGESYELLA
ncbi:MAG: hypothetical protein KDE53_32690, partial [Caldilineaceae bacterium]|nr:hypothetical protein [Caldilineaceae bacterium]